MLRHFCLSLLLFFAISPALVHAVTITPASLENITNDATDIIVGTAKSKVEEKKGVGRKMTTWTFEVKEVLKGDIAVGPDFIWKQMVPQGYELNKDYMLFLYCTGNFCVPKGSVQGVFKITTKPDGTKDVRNQTNNRFLFPKEATTFQGKTLSKGARAAMQEKGAISLENMRELVQTIEGDKGKVEGQ